MKFCSKCGAQLFDEAVVCTSCGCAVDGNHAINSQKNANDEVSIGFCILAFFIPLFGIIYWAVKAKETPKKAKACGITALVAWGVNILFSVLFVPLIVSLM